MRNPRLGEQQEAALDQLRQSRHHRTQLEGYRQDHQDRRGAVRPHRDGHLLCCIVKTGHVPAKRIHTVWRPHEPQLSGCRKDHSADSQKHAFPENSGPHRARRRPARQSLRDPEHDSLCMQQGGFGIAGVPD